MYGFEGHPRGAAAQQRHADGADREDAHRRLLGAAGARAAVPDLQPVHAAGGRAAAAFQQDPFPGNIIPAELINPVARAALEYIGMPQTAGSGRRHRQLPEPVAAGNHQVRHQHHPRRPQPDAEAAHLRARQLVRPEQQLQQLLRQPLDRRVVPVHLAPGRVRPRLRAQLDDGAEPALRLQLVRARHRHEPGQPRLRPDVARLPGVLQQRRFPTTSGGSRASTSPATRAPASAASIGRTTTQLVHRDAEQVDGRALAAGPAWSTGGTARPSEFFANNQTGQFNFDSTWTRGPLDNSPAAPGLARPVVRLLPARPAERRAASRVPAELRRGVVRRGASTCRTTGRPAIALTLNLGLRYEYETALVEADNQSVRGFDCDRRAADGSGGAGGAQSGGDRRAARPVQRPRRADVRRRRTASRADSTRRRRTTSCRASARPTGSTTRRSCAAATACSTGSSASAAATSSRAASARRRPWCRRSTTA